MKSLGQFVLVAWLLVALFVFFGNVLKTSFIARVVERNRRQLGIVSVALMMTWIVLLVLAGLFT